MSTLTQRLRLKRWTTASKWRNADLVSNWGILDAAPGLFTCTSSTHPTWDASQEGRWIDERDTGLTWRWNGTGFERTGPVGDLGDDEITSQVQTSSTALQTALTANVTVPEGGRSVRVSVAGPGVYSTVGLTRLALFRDSTQIMSWLSHGQLSGTATDQPRPLMMQVKDSPTAGAHTYTLQYSAEVGYGGTSTLQAETDAPLRLDVVEV